MLFLEETMSDKACDDTTVLGKRLHLL